MSPDWANVAGGASDIATVIATVAVGIFAYYKFVRGRIFRMRCGVEAVSRMVTVGTQKCAVVNVVFSNEGQAGVSIYRSADAHNKLIIYELSKLMLDDARESFDDVVWEAGASRQATLFRTVGKTDWTIVESGERFSTSVFIPLSHNAIGFRAVAILQIRSKSGLATKTAAYWTESIALPE
jgi:hypothetical protein